MKGFSGKPYEEEMETPRESNYGVRLFLHTGATTNRWTLGSAYHHHPCTPSLLPLI